MCNRSKRRTYNKEFKKEAVRLVLEEGYKAGEVERNLGIGTNIISRWACDPKEDPEYAFPGKGHLKPLMRNCDPSKGNWSVSSGSVIF